MNKAFVLGAGLGMRLRPLTAQLPKPLIPFFHRPLICSAFDHVIEAGAETLVVNTHHLPEAYDQAFPGHRYRDLPIHFRNESPDRLETAGGIANVRDLLDGDEPFLVYNGDILTNLPIQPLLDAHQAAGNLITLALRSEGPALHIALDGSSGQVTDIHNQLGTNPRNGFLFSGIYVVDPAFFKWLTPGKKESVIPIFLKLIEQGERLGGVILDDGFWWDLGNRETYLDAHLQLPGAMPAIHPDARIEDGVTLRGTNVIGPGARVKAGAVLEDSILWPEAVVEADASLHRCIVRSGIQAQGAQEGADL